MNVRRLRQCTQGLHCRWPLIGVYRRRRACTELAADASAEVVPLLVEALGDEDDQVRRTADQALRNLDHDSQACEALCELAVRDPDGLVARICAETGKRPKAARLACEYWIATGQEGVLRKVSGGEEEEVLCELAVRDPDGLAARICVETGKRPRDIEEACLFLLVTKQLDAYFEEDFEFQNLRLAYDRADPDVQAHVMDVVRSGDRRLLGFFGTRKKLSECSENEIGLFLDSNLRHRDWPRLFGAFLELPLKHSWSLLDHFRNCDWEPEAPELQSLYRQALKESNGRALPPVKKSDDTSPLFEHWLAEGHEGKWGGMDESALLDRLKSANPPEGVQIVTALAGASSVSEAAVAAVQKHVHWLVRLAGYATGLCGFWEDEVKDDNFWVRELAGASAVVNLWPIAATPADLDRVEASPGEAWTGKLGAARSVLRLLLAHRITAGTFDEMVVEADEFSGEFTRVDEDPDGASQ